MVSILVLLEPPLILKNYRLNISVLKVSILVLLEPPLIPYLFEGQKPKPPVSILVLLEPPLIHSMTYGGSSSYLCFNPCFTGTSSHTPRTAVRNHLRKEFQSLFYWNLLSYQNGEHSDRQKEISFNPCFTGTSSHTDATTHSGVGNSSFNPCFTGTSSHTENED